MTIRDLQYQIQDAIDTYGIPDDAEVRVGTNDKGEVTIRAEYGCGHFEIATNVNKEE